MKHRAKDIINAGCLLQAKVSSAAILVGAGYL